MYRPIHRHPRHTQCRRYLAHPLTLPLQVDDLLVVDLFVAPLIDAARLRLRDAFCLPLADDVPLELCKRLILCCRRSG